MYVYEESLKNTLINLGVTKGDIVYVASDITLMLNVIRKQYGIRTVEERNKFLNCFVDILQDIVTLQGTLLFPMYTWKFCSEHLFDRRTTKSEVGVLNNWIFDNRKDFQRTKHPMYSFMVWGKDSKYLLELNNIDSWGAGSPFEYFHHNKAKMLLLDVHLKQCFTFMHYVEECINIPCRYLKNFRGKYIDNDGSKSERSYTMFVRDLNIDSEAYEPDTMLTEPGVMVENDWLGIPLRLVDLAESYDIYRHDFLNNAGRNCYKFTNYILDCNSPKTHNDDLNN